METPSYVEIIYSEEKSLIGAKAKVLEVIVEKSEIDYRILTEGGYETFIPSEHISIIH